MCTGATRGLALLKFSTSPSRFGLFATIMANRIAVNRIGSESFAENIGLNFTLSCWV